MMWMLLNISVLLQIKFKTKLLQNFFFFITEFEQDAIYAPSSVNSTLPTHICF